MFYNYKNKKRNLWITTDLGGSDPDDYQSFIHLLQYSNYYNIKGVTCGYPRGKVSEARRIKRIYKLDYDKYNWKEKGLQSPKSIKLYQGKSKASDFSKDKTVLALVNESNKKIYSKENPLIILQWGSSTDLAAAIKNGLNLRNCVAYCVAGFTYRDWNARQDLKSFNLVEDTKGLKRIFAGSTIRGIYYGWDISRNRRFVKRQIKPRGELGKFFYDISRSIDTGSYSIKMGDTPSLLWALTSKELKPGKRSWGGRFKFYGNKLWGVVQGRRIGIFDGAKTISRRKFIRHWRKQLKWLYS